MCGWCPWVPRIVGWRDCFPVGAGESRVKWADQTCSASICVCSRWPLLTLSTVQTPTSRLHALTVAEAKKGGDKKSNSNINININIAITFFVPPLLCLSYSQRVQPACWGLHSWQSQQGSAATNAYACTTRLVRPLYAGLTSTNGKTVPSAHYAWDSRAPSAHAAKQRTF